MFRMQIIGAVLALVSTTVLSGEKSHSRKTDSLNGLKCVMNGLDNANSDQIIAYKGGQVHTCCANCKAELEKMIDSKQVPVEVAVRANHMLVATGQFRQSKCPLTGGPAKVSVTVQGAEVKVCCQNCTKKVKAAEGSDQLTLLFSEEAFDKAGYTMPGLWYIFYIESDESNRKALAKAISDKTRLFNRHNGTDQYSTYRILNGPRSGTFVRGFGPRIWADFDNPANAIQTITPDLDKEEVRYWRDHVRPLVKSQGNPELWQTIHAASYYGLGKDTVRRFVRNRFWKMKPGMYKRLEAHFAQFSDAMRAANIPLNRMVFRLESGGDFMTYSEAVFFDRWADYGLMSKVFDVFDELHGEGAWDTFLKEGSQIMQNNTPVLTEFWEYDEGMSSVDLSD